LSKTDYLPAHLFVLKMDFLTKTFYLFVFVFFACCTPNVKKDEPNTIYPLHIYHESELLFSFKDGVRIKFADPTPIIPDTNLSLIDSLVTYLNNNDFALLTITGFFEQNEGTKEHWSGNYGRSRAEYIKKLIIDRGIDESRIITEHIAQNLIFDDDNIHYGGFDFFLYDAKEKQNQSLVKFMYFSHNQAVYDDDINLVSYTDHLIAYLKIHPDKSVKIIGHHDKTETVDSLGIKRAKTVMDYFVENGIEKDIIKVESKRCSVPIALNNTEKEKNKNRRVKIMVY